MEDDVKALSKQELIDYIERVLPDDAMVTGFSTNAGDVFNISDDDQIFAPVTTYKETDFVDGIPDGTTHFLEVV